MATSRAHNLLNLNRCVWFGEVKRQDYNLRLPKILANPQKSSLKNLRQRSEFYKKTQSINYNLAPILVSDSCPLTETSKLILVPNSTPKVLKIENLKNLTPSSSNYSNYSSVLKAEPQPQEKEISQKSSPQKSDRPSLEQLLHVYNVLQETLPKLFVQPMDYKIYTQDVIFQNNITNKRTVGLVNYVKQVAYLRATGHFKFAYVKFELINMSQDADEGRVTVRWKIMGLSGLRVFLKFWKYKLWKWSEIKTQEEIWFEGISYFDVNSEGLIYQHTADRVEIDKDRAIDEVKGSKGPLLAKLALIGALFPKNLLPLENFSLFESLKNTSKVT